jgi:hypothetical protein
MTWDGMNDRRSRPRDKNDLDFTWQDAFFSMRREFHEHVAHNAEQERVRLEHYEKLDAKMDDMLIIKNQITGGVRVIALLGAGLLSVISFLATFWDQIMSFGHKVFTK